MKTEIKARAWMLAAFLAGQASVVGYLAVFQGRAAEAQASVSSGDRTFDTVRAKQILLTGKDDKDIRGVWQVNDKDNGVLATSSISSTAYVAEPIGSNDRMGLWVAGTNGCTLYMNRGKDKKTALLLTTDDKTDKDSPRIMMGRPDGDVTGLDMGIINGSPQIRLADQKGRIRIHALLLPSDEPAISLNSVEGKPKVGLGIVDGHGFVSSLDALSTP